LDVSCIGSPQGSGDDPIGIKEFFFLSHNVEPGITSPVIVAVVAEDGRGTSARIEIIEAAQGRAQQALCSAASIDGVLLPVKRTAAAVHFFMLASSSVAGP
jgi:hypothetical protein